MVKACKICRREGEKLILKGDRCLTQKCSFSRRSYAPGVHGSSLRKKVSDYRKQLREKQKAKSIYGLSESTMVKYCKIADKKEGDTIENLIRLIESRIDNIVYRCGLAKSRSAAKQMISHRKIILNDKKISVPSIITKEKDQIKYSFKSDDIKTKKDIPDWLKTTHKNQVIEVIRMPSKKDVDSSVDEKLVIEYYSR